MRNTTEDSVSRNDTARSKVQSGRRAEISKRARTIAERSQHLVRLAALGHVHQVKELLKRKCDFTVADDDGYTAIHRAAYNGHADTVAVLLERGADPFVRTVWDETAIDLAADAGHEGLVAMLERW